jgi:hypothetical protein
MSCDKTICMWAICFMRYLQQMGDVIQTLLKKQLL